jgi:hypothetical protein
MGDPEHVERTTFQRWVIGSGTVVAIGAAVVALTAGGTPNRAMQAPIDYGPAATTPAPASPAACATPVP